MCAILSKKEMIKIGICPKHEEFSSCLKLIKKTEHSDDYICEVCGTVVSFSKR